MALAKPTAKQPTSKHFPICQRNSSNWGSLTLTRVTGEKLRRIGTLDIFVYRYVYYRYREAQERDEMSAKKFFKFTFFKSRKVKDAMAYIVWHPLLAPYALSLILLLPSNLVAPKGFQILGIFESSPLKKTLLLAAHFFLPVNCGSHLLFFRLEPLLVINVATS